MSGFNVTRSVNYDAGIRIESDNNTITNNTLSDNGYGIELWDSSNCTIENNICSLNSDEGISFHDSSNITLDNNICSLNNENGISVRDSTGCIITNNTCLSNDEVGIDLDSSNNCILENNRMERTGIYVSGNLENWNSYIVSTSNTLNGKPVYYYKNCSGFTVQDGAGQIILTNATRIIVEKQNCSDGSVGILVGYSSNITLENNTFSSNTIGGIIVHKSSDCIIMNNICSLSDGDGIGFRDSSNLIIENNTCISNYEDGIHIGDSSNLIIENNNCSWNNGLGIRLWGSSNCTITHNTISGNRQGIYVTAFSRNIFANNNDIFDNTQYGMKTYENGYKINAINNWWGNVSGPYHPDKNPNGQGDSVSDEVTFKPWLLSNFSVKDVEPKEDDDSPTYVPFIISGLVGISFIGLLGAFYLREDVRFLLLSLLTAPLYTKLEKDDILDQPKRQNIYSYIVNKPGSNLTRLHKELPIGYGTIVHHLKVLEREKHIRSRKEMGRKLFSPTGTDWVAQKEKITGTETMPSGDGGEGGKALKGVDGNGEPSTRAGGGLDSLENLSSVPMGLRIINLLKENGPATQIQITEALGVGHTTISYNLRKLVEDGRVEKGEEKRGAMYTFIDE